MAAALEIPASLAGVQAVLDSALTRVQARFDEQLRSDLPPVSRLVGHVEHYRGKMLRPTLVVVSGLAAGTQHAARSTQHVSEAAITVAAVCEMVHMATLVHDDVLDEADVRRRGRTVNRLHGNEAAVILGDYLIAGAYHLCSTLDTTRASRLIGAVSMTICSGELLQLHHRGDFSLDEATYFEIIDRKTASLIGAACRLGAECSADGGADEATAGRFERFGRDIGMAFQIQDDLLDLLGREAVVGKSVGKDLEKGKLTLPVIHHLAAAPAMQRGRSLLLLERAAGPDAGDRAAAAAALLTAIESTGSIAEARRAASSLIERAKGELGALPDSPARGYLMLAAEAVLARAS